jgi:hypothetical protein
MIGLTTRPLPLRQQGDDDGPAWGSVIGDDERYPMSYKVQALITRERPNSGVTNTDNPKQTTSTDTNTDTQTRTQKHIDIEVLDGSRGARRLSVLSLSPECALG